MLTYEVGALDPPDVCRPAIVTGVPDHQRILVVSTMVGETELATVSRELGRDPVLITAPTAEAKRVVVNLDVEPQVELLLAPVTSPQADRGHHLDALVRRHALRDRFRDVVVVTDPASSALLLQALAPEQPGTGGAVTVVGLARGGRPVAMRRAVISGFGLGVLAYAADPSVPILALPALTASVGCALLLRRSWRHVGQGLLLAAAIAVTVTLAVAAGSARFPGAW